MTYDTSPLLSLPLCGFRGLQFSISDSDNLTAVAAEACGATFGAMHFAARRFRSVLGEQVKHEAQKFTTKLVQSLIRIKI